MTPYYADEAVTLHHGDCLDVLRTLPDASVDAVVTDPPYGLADHTPAVVAKALGAWLGGDREHVPDGRGFMGRDWDRFVPPPAVFDECLRVLKPGGHLLCFAGSRTVDLMTTSVRFAGFEIRDSIAWLYGCLSGDTEILTNEGWVRYDRAKEGQHALAFDIATGEVEWQPIQHVHRYWHNGEMVRLHSDATDQLLTPNHRVVLDQDRQTPHTPYVPSDEDLRRLLAGLPGPGPLPMGEEGDLLTGVRRQADLAEQGGQDSAAHGPQGADGPVCGLRDGDVEAGRLAETEQRSVLLSPMQRGAASGGIDNPLAQGPRGLDGHEPRVVSGEDDRSEQPRLEGRRYRVQEARELCRGQVRAGAGVGAADGPQGRLHHGAPPANGGDVWLSDDAAGSGQPREPRPEGQSARESDALAVESGAQALRVGPDGSRRVLPSTRVTAERVDYAGVVWCITVPHGAFIARRNGLIFATGNSGFPKSLDVSKAIDKQRTEDRAPVDAVRAWLNARRLEAGLSHDAVNKHFGHASNGGGSSSAWMTNPSSRNLPTWDQWLVLKSLFGFADGMDAEVWRLNGRKGKPGDNWDAREVVGQSVRSTAGFSAEMVPRPWKAQVGQDYDLTAAHTPEAQQWQGWGTALKPSHEPVIVARKPLTGTVASTVLEHGTGALNIAACRIPATDKAKFPEGYSKATGVAYAQDAHSKSWLAGADRNPDGRWPTNVVLDESQAAELDKQTGVSVSRIGQPRGAASGEGWGMTATGAEYADSGGASRFFPVFRYEAKAPTSERPRDGETAHPTVKPLDLMRWLVRLVTPPGGTVLEPFAGSGTTAEACVIEGFRCIAIEREADYLPLIVNRLSKPIQIGLDFEGGAA